MRNKLQKNSMCLKWKILKLSYFELKVDLVNFTGYNVKGINSLCSNLFKMLYV